MELPVRLELTTYCLQGSCSADWAREAYWGDVSPLLLLINFVINLADFSFKIFCKIVNLSKIISENLLLSASSVIMPAALSQGCYYRCVTGKAPDGAWEKRGPNRENGKYERWTVISLELIPGAGLPGALKEIQRQTLRLSQQVDTTRRKTGNI